MPKKIEIHELLNTDYLEYAKYVVFERAIPYMFDGFKPTQRKIIYVSLKRAKTNMINVSALAGYVKAESKYHHADSSLDGQIVGLSQDFKCSIPYFIRQGQFGSAYSPENAATRYLEVKLSKAFELLFMDTDLVTKQFEEGYEIEPEYYFPILPTVLLNAINGIAIGYAFSSTNRSPIDLANVCLNYLKGKKCNEEMPIPPYVNGLVGKWVWHNGNKQWEHHGIVTVKNTTTVEITGLPLGWTYDSYESFLNELDKSEWLVEYTNLSTKGNILYELKFTREQLARYIEEDSLYHTLKMFSVVEKDNFTIIDTNQKPFRFETDHDLAKAFVEWRLSIYTKRKANKIENLEYQIKLSNEVIKFIQLVIDGKILVHKTQSKESLIDLLKHTWNFELAEELSELKIYRLTIDEQNKRAEKLKAFLEELEYYKTTTEKDLYIIDLKNLIKQLRNEGYSEQQYEIWN